MFTAPLNTPTRRNCLRQACNARRSGVSAAGAEPEAAASLTKDIRQPPRSRSGRVRFGGTTAKLKAHFRARAARSPERLQLARGRAEGADQLLRPASGRANQDTA